MRLEKNKRNYLWGRSGMMSTSAAKALQSTFLSSRRTREAAPHVGEKMERNYRSDIGASVQWLKAEVS